MIDGIQTLPLATQRLVEALVQNRCPTHAILFHAEAPTPLDHVVEAFLELWFSTYEPLNTLPFNKHPDVIHIKPENNLKMEHVQHIQEITKYGPQNSKKQFVIIHNTDTFSTSAANSFLKTLETPPPGVCFMLLTHAPHKLLPTITSRCQKFYCQKFHTTPQTTMEYSFEHIMQSPLFKNLEISEKLTAQKAQVPDILTQWLSDCIKVYPTETDYSDTILQTLYRLNMNGNTKLQLDYLLTRLRLLQNQKLKQKQQKD